MSVFMRSSKTCFQDATNKPVLISLYLSWRKLEITKTCKAKNANPKPPPSDISTFCSFVKDKHVRFTGARLHTH